MMLVGACSDRGMSPTEAACLTIIAVSRGPLKALLVPLFAAFDALLGVMGADVGWHLPVTA
jgi:hypothetical protein